MRTALLVVALLASVLAPVPAAAQVRAQIAVRYSTEYDRCLRKSAAARTPAKAVKAAAKCRRDEIDRQDERREAAYKLARSRLKGGAKRKALRLSERAWIKELKTICPRASKRDSTVTYAICTIDETIKRTIQLERYRG